MRAKLLFAALVLLIAADALILNGRYRGEFAHQTEVVEEQVLEQNWSTPLVG